MSKCDSIAKRVVTHADLLQVAVGVIHIDDTYLVAKRLSNQTLALKWEFPGGKLEPGETPKDALCRELDEELGIEVESARPLIRIPFICPEYQVLLHVWLVDAFNGTPKGMLGQPIAFKTYPELCALDFPEANQYILKALGLSEQFAICDLKAFNADILNRLVKYPEAILRLRQADLSFSAYHDLVCKALFAHREMYPSIRRTLILDFSTGWQPNQLKAFQSAYSGLNWGMHLSAKHAKAIDTALAAGKAATAAQAVLLEAFNRFRSCVKLIGISCHQASDIAFANALEVDYLLLSPVAETHTHPNAKPLGWEKFSEWVDQAKSPVYALGGMQLEDLPKALDVYAQGVAGIGWWQN